MEPTQELIQSIRRERVRRSASMRPETKVLEGPRLFEHACRVTLSGIRKQFPNISDAEAQRILQQRLDRHAQRELRS